MRLLLFLLAIFVLCVPASADTYVTEDITTDTTWDLAGSPYIIESIIYLQSASTLTIDPGVTVELSNGSSLHTNSGCSIVAVGAEGSEILFTSGRETPGPNDWFAVTVASSPASVFAHCVFEYGRYNLSALASDVSLSFCTSRYAEYTGFMFQSNANPTMTSCSASFTEDGVRIYNSSPVITSCNFTDNIGGIYLNGPESYPVIHDCNIYNNSGGNMYVRDYDEGPLVTIDAENNWWGVDTAPEIEATIDIATASAGNVEVDFDPWLHEVPVETTSWGRLKAMFAE